MTTIVLHNNTLYGDRKVIKRGIPVVFFDEPKVTRSVDGEFAYGSTGWSIRDERRPIIEQIMRETIEFIVGRLPEDRTDIIELPAESKLHKMLGETWGVFFCTRDNAYRYSTVHKNVAEFPRDTTMGIGTGGPYVVGMLEAGATIARAYKEVGFFECVTGSKVDAIPMSSLKPFVIRGKSDV